MILSVIVTVYNYEKYLNKCIESIINQSLKDIEIILVDDGSTDSSGAICDRYKQDKRVRVIHQSNQGMSKARYVGVNASGSQYVTFVDADDFVEQESFIVAQKSMMEEFDVICTGWVPFTDEGIDVPAIASFEGCPIGKYNRGDIEKEIMPKMIWKNGRPGLNVSLCNKIIKKSLIKKSLELLNGHSLCVGEDAAIFYPVIKMSKSLVGLHSAYYRVRRKNDEDCSGWIKRKDYFDQAFFLYNHLKKQFDDDKRITPQIEQYYMYIVNLRQKVYKKFNQGTGFVFPFDKVKKGEKVILYGAGHVGQTYHQQVEAISYCKIILWVDKNYRSYADLNVKPIDALDERLPYDKIVIAILDNSTVQKVKNDLINMGMSERKIVLS